MKKRILIIEDEHEISRIIKIRLEINGYEVVQAFDGEEGLSRTKASLPDLILLDLVLPKLGGIEVLEALKADEKYKNIPVIVVTALSQDTFNVAEAAVRPDAYFMKPFDSVELVATIDDFLKEPS